MDTKSKDWTCQNIWSPAIILARYMLSDLQNINSSINLTESEKSMNLIACHGVVLNEAQGLYFYNMDEW